MAEQSLGVVYPSGHGPVRATSNRLDPTAAVWAHSYVVQHAPGNAGKGWVGGSDLNGLSGEGTFGYLPAPGDVPWPRYESQKCEGRQNPINMADVYLDTETATDGLLVTFMVV